MIHYLPNKLLIVKKYNWSENQNRSVNQRSRNKINCRINIKEIQDKTVEFVRNRSMNEDYKTVHDSDSSFEENDSESQIDAEKEKVNSQKQINRQMSKGEKNEDVINEAI